MEDKKKLIELLNSVENLLNGIVGSRKCSIGYINSHYECVVKIEKADKIYNEIIEMRSKLMVENAFENDSP